MSHCPWMDSVVLTTANVPQNLLTLLQAIDSKIPKKCQAVQLQVDILAGGAKVFVGNSQVSATHCGAVLVATMAATPIGYDSNLILLSDIWLVSDTNAVQVNCTVVTR